MIDCATLYANPGATVSVPALPNVNVSVDVVLYLSPEIPAVPEEPDVPAVP
jgi:hypothetical protein